MNNCYNPNFLENNYVSVKPISSRDTYKLFKVLDSSNKAYLLKLFKAGIAFKDIEKEIILGQFFSTKEKEGNNFIRYISSDIEPNSQRIYIKYELAEKLENYLITGLYLDEKMAKNIFWKVANSVIYLHKNGIAHMNIALNKIFIDDNYNIKLGVFDSAEFVGMETYANTFFKEDIFQLGILLIQLITGKCDLKNHDSNLLKLIQKREYEKFWKMIEAQNNKKLSKELKDLIIILLTIKSKKQKEKKNLDEIIKNSTWFKGIESIDKEQYLKEYLKQLEELYQ